MQTDLTKDITLKTACDEAWSRFKAQDQYNDWLLRLSTHLSQVRTADRGAFVSGKFQRDLWDSEAISATGMGQIDASSIHTNPSVTAFLWELRNAALPSEPQVRAELLVSKWEECLSLIQPLVARVPKLKLYRVFAALRPESFTTIAHDSKVNELARAMGMRKGADHAIVLHQRILDRLAEVIGPVETPPSSAGLERMTLPWLLYASQHQAPSDEATTVVDSIPGSEQLKPLPAERRRRGLLAIRGFLPSIRSMIEFAKDGCNREDFKEHIRSVNPNLAFTSIPTNLNALIAEWGVLRAEGDSLFLTPRGEALLQTGDPDEVADWLLTRILGFDNVLATLKSEPTSVRELISELKGVNPGWTTDYAPAALINWIRALGLAVLDNNKLLRLTESGRNWATRIGWTPGSLLDDDDAEAAAPAEIVRPSSADVAKSRPSIDRMIETIPSGISIDVKEFARLDAALWLHPRRHFAVLTGLSGAGKTQIARAYGLALWANESQPQGGLLTVPVQPGWHDPSSLLGYLNPLISGTYSRTRFLDFVLQAAGDPSRPYTVVLDEMNLSHPEQYLAPLLSAMETVDYIELHGSRETVDGVPPRIRYPENLVLIGTVNMDETTHGLSDKVLDRASVMEFWDIDVAAYPGWEDIDLPEETKQRARAVLVELAFALRPTRLHFGWRTIGDVLGYLHAATERGKLNGNAALDYAIYSKVLPKLRGEDSPRLRQALTAARAALASAHFPKSSGKLDELATDLEQIGTVRFWR